MKYENALFTGDSSELTRDYVKIANEDEYSQLHKRLGHPGNERLNMCLRMIGKTEVKRTDHPCITCIGAKKVKRQNHHAVPRANFPLSRVYMDFWGPYKEGVKEIRYYLSLVDDYSRFSSIYLTKDRKNDTVKEILEKWMKWAERFQTAHSGKDRRLLVIRTLIMLLNSKHSKAGPNNTESSLSSSKLTHHRKMEWPKG